MKHYGFDTCRIAGNQISISTLLSLTINGEKRLILVASPEKIFQERINDSSRGIIDQPRINSKALQATLASVRGSVPLKTLIK